MATVELTWTDNASNEDGFRVYRTTTESPSFPGDYTQIEEINTADTESYTDTNAPGGDEVFYAVTSFNSNGESSETTDSVRTLGSVLSTNTSGVVQADVGKVLTE